MATFDALFRGVGKDLVELFGSACVYHQHGAGAYDPMTGTVTTASTDHAVKVGVEEIKRTEDGGPGETHQALMWFSHVLLPLEPTTADSITYRGSLWKVVNVDPEYAGDQIIAWKILARTS